MAWAAAISRMTAAAASGDCGGQASGAVRRNGDEVVQRVAGNEPGPLLLVAAGPLPPPAQDPQRGPAGGDQDQDRDEHAGDDGERVHGEAADHVEELAEPRDEQVGDDHWRASISSVQARTSPRAVDRAARAVPGCRPSRPRQLSYALRQAASRQFLSSRP